MSQEAPRKPMMPARIGTADEVQLSLFDFRPANRILCLPISELHGATFARVFVGRRPTAVVDVRSHPYFDMVSLDRAAAFQLFRRVSCEYVHLPLDLRPPADQAGRWTLRARAVEILDSLAGSRSGAGFTFAFLIDRKQDVPVLENAVRHLQGQRAMSWTVEVPAPPSVPSGP